MKMNKIVLASLLSVSLLGMSTSAFALDNAADTGNKTANTTTNFEVTGGSLALSDATPSLDFGSVSVAKLLSDDQTLPAKTGFKATVTDTLGDVNSGWTLSAKYTPLHAGDAKLGETLNIGKASLSVADKSTPIYAASADDVATALSKYQGVMTAASANTDITLALPKQGAAAKSYEGGIAWTLAATPKNEAADAGVTNSVTPTTPAS